MVYLHLAMTNFKGQCQSHEHFYCEYIEKVGIDWTNVAIANSCEIAYWLSMKLLIGFR